MSEASASVKHEQRCFICGDKIPDNPYKPINYDGTVNTSITYIWHGLCLKCKRGEKNATS